MIIECSTCKKRYKLNQSKIPSGTKQAKCKKHVENQSL
ncbi:MAG: zinc-ribbon domain-containing protein [Candidatus Electrothrix sp. YB6]